MIQSWHRVTRQKVTQSFDRIREIVFPPLIANEGAEGPLVIEAEIGGYTVHRMYVDGGSSMERGNNIADRTDKTVGDYRRCKTFYRSMDELYDSEVTITIQQYYRKTHGMIKFLVKGGVVTIRSTIFLPMECATITATPKNIEEKTKKCPENFQVAIHPDFPDQEISIGGTLSAKGRTKLCALLKMDLDIFAWQPSDMTGVPRSIAEHKLNIRKGYLPVRQKKRGQDPERAKAIQAEVQKLMEARIMRKVYYHDWLSNPVMVKKHDGS
ncbi:hypothetical protein Tco_1498863 [Tanacetum coccineum]